jgi:hypothetical protein
MARLDASRLTLPNHPAFDSASTNCQREPLRGTRRRLEVEMRASSILLLAWAVASPLHASGIGLDGDWVVDLSTEPGKPYTQPMQLVLGGDGQVSGRFYNSVIESGRWKDSRGRVCASFRTTDGQGPYHTSVCLTGDTATGQTWAEHRDFLFNWVAKRAPAGN